MTTTDGPNSAGDAALVRVTVRLPKGYARQMRVEAMLHDMTIEATYLEAVTAYLLRHFKKISVPEFRISGFHGVSCRPS